MYFPGSRTLRRLANEMFMPARALGRQFGYQQRAEQFRQLAVAKYLDVQTKRQGPIPAVAAALDWARLTVDASGPSGYFFSENLVSNESEFLRAGRALESLASGLACLGVGPEPMLTYLGLVDTSLAFVVDIRRDNARLHYLYRGIFECANTRCEWLSLLLGRPYRKCHEPGPSAPIDVVLDEVAAQMPTEASFQRAHAQIQQALDRLPPHRLPYDRWRMRSLHRHFWRYGTALTFQLGGLRLRRYPSLESLLRASSPEGQQLGFLANEATFRRILAHERASRVIPVVGDISGAALLRVGRELHERGLRLGALYISNVEQYLFENDAWDTWIRNLEQLPWHERAIIIRSYFENDRGPVPDAPKSLLGQLERTWAVARATRFGRAELPIHQMRTVVHSLPAFLGRERQKSYRGFRELVCDQTIVGAVS